MGEFEVNPVVSPHKQIGSIPSCSAQNIMCIIYPNMSNNYNILNLYHHCHIPVILNFVQ